MKALILAGGLGTRLRSALPDKPKVMAPVNGKPFLEYQIELLERAGVREIVLCVGYRKEMIMDYFGDGERVGLAVHYSSEREPLGTAGAVKNAAEYLTEDSIVLNGDTYFCCDLKALVSLHKANSAVATLALHPATGESRYGSVALDERGRITSFAEKSSGNTPLISGGTYVFSPKMLDFIPIGRSSSLETEVFPGLIESQSPVYGMVDDGYFKDIGTPESWEEFGRDILNMFCR